MSTNPRGRVQFAHDVADLIAALQDATRLTAAAERQAAKDRHSGAFASITRRFSRLVQEPVEAAEDELHRYGERLRAVHAELGHIARAQLQRDVAAARHQVAGAVLRHEQRLSATPLHRGEPYRMDVGAFRTIVREALKAIVPEARRPARGAAAGPQPQGTLLSRAASAFADGHGVEQVTDHIDARAHDWWKARIGRYGIEATLPAITEEAGGDPVEAARLTGRLLGGVLIGARLDRKTRRPVGLAVVDPTHTTLALGASGVGKTTGLVAPYAAQRAAAGDNVLLVTSQAQTIALVASTAKALSGQADIPVIDFGGEIVSTKSEAFSTWDPTRRCLSEEGARRFADAFAGPKLPARQALTNAEYWGGMVFAMYAAAGHVAAGIRELHGLDPHGLNGMARVYHLLPLTSTAVLPDEFPAAARAALADFPEQLRAQEALFADAKAHAERFHPRLQRIAFHEHLLKAQGLQLSDEVVGEKLLALSGSLEQFAKARNGDPMERLMETFREAVPPREAMVMSPRPGSNEVDPVDLVRPGAGMAIISYAQTQSTGLGPGAFASEILDVAIAQNKDVGMFREMGGRAEIAKLSLVVDEGTAARYIARLPDVVTETRQLGISALLSMTSEHHLRSVLDDADAGKFLQAPCVVDLTPPPAKSTELAPLFGQEIVKRTTEGSNPAGGGETVSRAEHEVDVVRAADLSALRRDQALMQYPSDPEGERIGIVALPQFNDPATVVGSAAEHVREHPEEFTPTSDLLGRLRPDLMEQVRLQNDPASALVQGSSEALMSALTDPVEAPASTDDFRPAPPEPVEESLDDPAVPPDSRDDSPVEPIESPPAREAEPPDAADEEDNPNRI